MSDNEKADGVGIIAQALIIYAAFVITVVILFTDKNLQTDFGLVTSGYFYHWYGLFATAIVAVAGASALITFRSRGLSIAGTAGSGVMTAFLVLDVLTYGMVAGGAFTLSGFATYLFGFGAYSGALSYIPGLYDILIAVYAIATIAGVFAVRSSGKA